VHTTSARCTACDRATIRMRVARAHARKGASSFPSFRFDACYRVRFLLPCPALSPRGVDRCGWSFAAISPASFRAAETFIAANVGLLHVGLFLCGNSLVISRRGSIRPGEGAIAFTSLERNYPSPKKEKESGAI